VREVVEGRQEADDEGDGEVEQQEQQVLDRGLARAPRVEDVEQHDGQDAEQRARAACAGDAVRREVAAEYEPEDTGAEVHDQESRRADDLLNVPRQRQLQQQIEGDVDEAAMQENGYDETEPLVWLRRLSSVRKGCDTHAKSAQIFQSAEAFGRSSETRRVGTIPSHLSAAEICTVDDVRSHAWDETGAHVDENIW